jgi:hypothetical protein
MNLPKVPNLRKGGGCGLGAIALGAVALFRLERLVAWPHSCGTLTDRDVGSIICRCVAGRSAYRATMDGPEFVGRGCSGGKGAGCTDSRRRSDV